VDLANALHERPDLIVSGHTHSLVGAMVNGIPIIQARTAGTTLGVVDFVVQSGARTVQLRAETVWTDREQADTAVARVVEQYRRETDRLVNRSIVALAVPLRRQGDQYPLGNMIADAYREAARADVVLVNNGGIRNGLEPGAISWGNVFEVLPFQNFIVRLSVSGSVLRRALERADGGSDTHAHVSGLRVRVDPARPEGQRVTALALEDGRPVEDSARYTLAVPDFMALGGSGYAMLRGLPYENSGVVDLDAFIQYLRRQPQPVGRFVPVERRVDDGSVPQTERRDDAGFPTRRGRRP
jgi:2',3'-cyclic-nucleotide 2'-phosphodiesterase (5'-nucleotidase family)